MVLERHYFPGNNTTEGFFSYYNYILGQREANRIFCIKGGPGVGKSTFMKKLGEYFLEQGEGVDFLHCSSDPNSLDGVVLRERRIALIDATSPHVVEPINPGAVDMIVYLGEFWDEDGIRENKVEVIETNEKIKKLFNHAYNYFSAAGKIYDNISVLYSNALEQAEVYKLTAHIVGKELAHKEICLNPGHVKKFFASALTPHGLKNHIKSIIQGYKKVYIINSPIGVSATSLLGIFADSAMYRGFDVEEYFCPMKPQDKIEHLLVPELGIAFVSVNKYHDLEPWELFEDESQETTDNIEIVHIDMNDMIDNKVLENVSEHINENIKDMDNLINRGITYLKLAKSNHDKLESFYIPNMDFKKVEALLYEIIAKIDDKGYNQG